MKLITTRALSAALFAVIGLTTGPVLADDDGHPKVRAAIEKSKILLEATRVVAKSQKDHKKAMRRAIFFQRAAKVALKKGKPGAALHLTKEARSRAREVLRSTAADAPAAANDAPGEFDEANETEARDFVAMLKKRMKKRLKKRRGKRRGAAGVVKDISDIAEVSEIVDLNDSMFIDNLNLENEE